MRFNLASFVDLTVIVRRRNGPVVDGNLLFDSLLVLGPTFVILIIRSERLEALSPFYVNLQVCKCRQMISSRQHLPAGRTNRRGRVMSKVGREELEANEGNNNVV